MKDEGFDKLLERYKEGKSTLKEEDLLFRDAENRDPSLEAWSTFMKRNKWVAPESLNDRLWDSFQNRTKSNRRLKIGALTAAASIAFMIAFLVGNRGQNELSYQEKKALLDQALHLFPQDEPTETQQSIIYENDMIVIYTVTE